LAGGFTRLSRDSRSVAELAEDLVTEFNL